MNLKENWRPILMLWFGFLLGLHWLGLTPSDLSEDTIKGTLEIIKIGVGTYVVGRTAEKVVTVWKEKPNEAS